MSTTTKEPEAKTTRQAADSDIAVDGYTWGEIEAMVHDSVVTARCVYCEAELEIEPDAKGYDCHQCGGAETISSPLVKLGLI